MINYADIIFCLLMSVIGVVVFSGVIILITDIGAKEKPTYYKIENHDIYVVYKWSGGRGKCYQEFKFKKDGNKLIYLKRKMSYPTLTAIAIILAIFFIIAVIKAGLLTGIAVLLDAAFVFGSFGFILTLHNVLYCKRFLTKKLG